MSLLAAREIGEQRRQTIDGRLLVEVHDPPGGVHLEDAERRGLLGGDGDDRDGGVGAAVAVGLDHLPVIHVVELIARKDQEVAPRCAPHVAQALADGVGGPLEPVAAFFGLLGRQHADEARREDVELVGERDVLVEALRVELGEHEDLADVRVQAVADRDVDEAVLAADRNRRLQAFEREGKEARTASATEDNRQHVVHAGSVSPPAAPRYFGADVSGLLLRRTAALAPDHHRDFVLVVRELLDAGEGRP